MAGLGEQNNIHTGMAEDNKGFNTNRAVCNAADDAERADMTASNDSSQVMLAVFLRDHVKVGAKT